MSDLYYIAELGLAMKKNNPQAMIGVAVVWEGRIRNLELDKSGEWQWFKTDILPDNMLLGHKAGVEILMNNKPDLQIVEL